MNELEKKVLSAARNVVIVKNAANLLQKIIDNSKTGDEWMEADDMNCHSLGLLEKADLVVVVRMNNDKNWARIK